MILLCSTKFEGHRATSLSQEDMESRALNVRKQVAKAAAGQPAPTGRQAAKICVHDERIKIHVGRVSMSTCDQVDGSPEPASPQE